MIDRPAGAYILDEKTGKLAPDTNDPAMKARADEAKKAAPEQAQEVSEDA